MKPERRRQRSDDPITALSLFLQSVLKQRGLKAAAISDRDGLLLAGAAAEASIDLETLAAVGPIPGLKLEGRAVDRRPGAGLWLVSVGGSGPPGPDASIAATVGRILGLEPCPAR